MINKRVTIAVLLVSTVLALPQSARAARQPKQAEWLGTELPLPLPVRTPQDLLFKQEAERQYLTFNLMAAGKVLWDAGDFAGAADKWETLLQIPGLDREIDKAVRPLAIDARSRAGKPGAVLPPPPPADAAPAAAAAAPAQVRKSRTVVVEGVVSGGGVAGPGGTIVTLHRLDGSTPKPAPIQGRVVQQHHKQFEPHVLAVTVGSTIVFRNAEADDENKGIFHDVFSLSPAAKFDTGLYQAPGEKEQLFDKPGVVQLLCNIHAKMQGFVDVVDTPWFGQADGSGAFHISGVPPGEYQLEAWNEFAAQATTQKITVTREPQRLAVTVGGDRSLDPNPPDKYGKPRQEHLGY